LHMLRQFANGLTARAVVWGVLLDVLATLHALRIARF